MTPLAPDTMPPATSLAGLEPLKTVRSRWPAIIGAVLSLAMVGVLAWELLRDGLDGLSRAVPADPRFWVAFALFYMALPVGDFVIFRRLWGIPASGLVALLKKRIANDVLITYSGEAYFYTWARERASMVAAPFGAIKDVSILSAIAGNTITLIMLAVALPLGRDLLTPDDWRTALWSTVGLIAMSVPFLIFSRRVFSLTRHLLWIVFGIQSARVIASSSFTALAWHYALPTVSLGMWVLLAAGRLLVSRLPLIPSTAKGPIFFTFATLLIGQDQALRQLIALFESTILLTNVILIGCFALHGIATRRRPW